MEGPGFNVGYLAMNTSKKPFNNLKVRKALAHALNKKAYIEAIYLGHAVSATNPIPPSLWSYHKGIKDDPYDLASAKKTPRPSRLSQGF